jgi:transcriptional regulator with GAF, ATPase, and Fis domain
VWHRTEFRLICATNRDLEHLVKEGAFRGDLFYRIADWVMRPPPLRERRDDILLLAAHFLAAGANGRAPEIDRALADYLVCRDYPGNVRDLRRLVMRLHARHVGEGPITLGALPPEDRPSAGRPPEPFGEPGFMLAVQRAMERGIGLKDISRAAAGAAIRLALERESGNLARAARRLGVTDRALQIRRANGDLAAAGTRAHRDAAEES